MFSAGLLWMLLPNWQTKPVSSSHMFGLHVTRPARKTLVRWRHTMGLQSLSVPIFILRRQIHKELKRF